MGSEESKPLPSPTFEKPWRDVDWSKRKEFLAKLTNYKPNHPNVEFLRILLHGPVGAGKSSFITSLDTVFKERVTATAPAGKDEFSCTRNYTAYFLRNKEDERLPIAFCDVMGMEKGNQGIHTDDVINAVNGHLPDNYLFNPFAPLEVGKEGYNDTPTLQDKPHCLVSVVSANSICRMDEVVLKEMIRARKAAQVQGIPHVAIMTMPDLACQQVGKDLREIYTRKSIKEKMEQCSQLLGISMNCILPVRNYTEEIAVNEDMDVLLLMALSQIVNFANDHLWRIQNQPKSTPTPKPKE